jgi:putative hydrolase of the HAD superfamily
VEVSTRIIHKLSDDYITYLSTFNHLFPGTIELLEYLQPNYKLHIITNGFKEVQHGKLNQSNIDHFFQTVTNSEMVGVKKPNPRIFNHALQMAKATTEESLMIGDNLEADIMGALNFGMEAICFNYHKEILETNIIGVDHLLELKNYI